MQAWRRHIDRLYILVILLQIYFLANWHHPGTENYLGQSTGWESFVGRLFSRGRAFENPWEYFYALSV